MNREVRITGDKFAAKLLRARGARVVRDWICLPEVSALCVIYCEALHQIDPLDNAAFQAGSMPVAA